MAFLAVTVCLGWVFSLCLHEFGHALVAYWGGDTSVKDKGYLTFNPLKYTDPGLSLMLPLFFLIIGGIALPGGAVYIDHSRLRSRFWESAVSVAGPVASWLAAVLLATPFWLNFAPSTPDHWFWNSLALLIFLDIYIVFINLIPIPPLDGYGIIEPWLPLGVQQKCRKFSNYGLLVLIIILWTVEPVNRFFWFKSAEISVQLNVPPQLAFQGLRDFQSSTPLLVVALLAVLWFFRSKERGLYQKAHNLIRWQQYEKAIATLDQAIEIKPEFQAAWRDRAFLHHYLQQYHKALEGYKKLTQWQPQNPEYWQNRGVVHGKLKQYEDALACLDQALELNPENSSILEDKAYTLEQSKQYSQALQLYERKIDLNLQDSFAWLRKGVILTHFKRYKEAVLAFDQAITLEGDNPYVWYHKAICFAKQNFSESALEYLQQAIDLDSSGDIKEQAQTEPVFQSFSNYPRFQSMVK
ncbi:tetratricopeptide repeat protein [Spirulina sp. CS-785/01]|uniref:tetratricopeptide repeat protein n=1 Tax=Spirulina sp. CS-785/01 TaxID=3021716 RepID=UPI00232DDC4F|nr:tetratricopeptide repeat protein [Spirulina sp. CS-785/01]MDB9313951.1 tetratricopeptide repeat protein [Spirulina sp. CS-785/01]